MTGVAFLALVALFLATISKLGGDLFRPQQLGVGRGELSGLAQQSGVARACRDLLASSAAESKDKDKDKVICSDERCRRLVTYTVNT